MLLLGAVLLFGITVNGSFTNAQTTVPPTNNVNNLNAEKNARQIKLAQINRQIQGLTKQISDTRAKSNTLKNELFIFDKEIASTELQIQAKNTQIEDTDLQINELEKLIQQKINDINENKKILGILIQQLAEFDNLYYIQTTLGSGSLSDFLDQIQYNNSVQEKFSSSYKKSKN